MHLHVHLPTNARRALTLAFIMAAPLLASPAWAQEASPPTEVVPVEVLSSVDLPEHAALSMFRATLEPQEMIPLHPHTTLEMTFIAAGSATLRPAEGPAVLAVRGTGEPSAKPETAGPGEDLTVIAGDVVIIPPGNVFEASAGKEGVTVLIFEFADLAGDGTPAP